jgi:4-diphosphocytidyl-2-C-methyl-D-erythritol kinase
LLTVGALRADGYHALTTVYQAVSLTDRVTATAGAVRLVAVRGLDAGAVPTGRDNLAARASRALARRAGLLPEVRLSIDKAIPMAAGLAGGSADAAAALVACDALWGTGLDRGELAALAEGLGSDVPFALLGGTALGLGRGEQVTPVLSAGRYHWVLALAERGLATAQVYAEHDRWQAGRVAVEGPGPEDVLAALRAGDPAALGSALHNDLEPAALRLRPGLRRVLDTGRDLGAVGAVVSGSGPTCAFLARSEPEAVALAASLAGMGVCRSVRRVSGPVPGTRLVEPTG